MEGGWKMGRWRKWGREQTTEDDRGNLGGGVHNKHLAKTCSAVGISLARAQTMMEEMCLAKVIEKGHMSLSF